MDALESCGRWLVCKPCTERRRRKKSLGKQVVVGKCSEKSRVVSSLGALPARISRTVGTRPFRRDAQMTKDGFRELEVKPYKAE